MRLLVISDTHIPGKARRLPAAVVEAARVADGILHCGDLVELEVLWQLQSEAQTGVPVYAVHGNVDAPEVQEELPATALIEQGGARIGLTHGHLSPPGKRWPDTPSRAAAHFPAADVVCFGHSHQPLIERRGGQLLVNPGSATDRRREPTCSMAWLIVRQGRVEAEIVPIVHD